MRFGKSAAEAAEEPGRGGGSGDWIRNLRDGDNTFRILQDKDDGWIYYWEHFNPAGFSFPCPRDKDDPEDMCPGCSSDNERMKKVSRKIAFNVLQSSGGQEYVNVYKVPNAVAGKLENRINRFGTVTDRDYTITRFKTPGDRYDFDVEGGVPTPVDVSKYELHDIQEMLAQQWEDAWGNGDKPEPVKPAARPTIAAAPKQQEEPPFEEQVYQEADLRKMELEDLLVLIKREMKVTPPDGFSSSDDAVDWLMSIQP